MDFPSFLSRYRHLHLLQIIFPYPSEEINCFSCKVFLMFSHHSRKLLHHLEQIVRGTFKRLFHCQCYTFLHLTNIKMFSVSRISSSYHIESASSMISFKQTNQCLSAIWLDSRAPMLNWLVVWAFWMNCWTIGNRPLKVCRLHWSFMSTRSS